MGPVGAAGLVMVAAAAVLAVILGAFAGAIAWAIQRGLLWAGLLAAGAYLAIEVVLGSAAPVPALVALGCALLLGFLWGFSFRLGLWVPAALALPADACLIVLLYRSRKVDGRETPRVRGA